MESSLVYNRADRIFYLWITAMIDKKLRVLIAKPGLDGHDRGAKVIARALRDSGMEVIYTGLRQTPEMICEAALQEDVNAIGLSILSGAHMTLIPRVMELLHGQGQEHIQVLVGGIIPDEDIPRLKEIGVTAVFGPGTTTQAVIQAVVDSVASVSAHD
jgi:methylmalonyl-CoA mutase C-terminal domain/subunit